MIATDSASARAAAFEIREYRESDWPGTWPILQETVRAEGVLTLRANWKLAP